MTARTEKQMTKNQKSADDMAADEMTAEEMIATIVQIFSDHGDDEYLGEPVTMSEHMLQAAHFAVRSGADEATVIAALIHDIGHFTSAHGAFSMQDTKDKFHEHAGASVLEGHFPQIVVDAVRHHVAAKRYLCAVDQSYHDGLSAASRHSLSLQGGPMSEAEQAEFAASTAHLDQILLVRRCDDQGKVPGLKVAPLEDYLPMMRRVLTGGDRSSP